MTMAEVMEADAPQSTTGNQTHPFVGEGARLDRFAVCLGHDKRLPIGSNAESQEFLSLFYLPGF